LTACSDGVGSLAMALAILASNSSCIFTSIAISADLGAKKLLRLYPGPGAILTLGLELIVGNTNSAGGTVGLATGILE
jgi:hypothetical protein